MPVPPDSFEKMAYLDFLGSVAQSAHLVLLAMEEVVLLLILPIRAVV